MRPVLFDYYAKLRTAQKPLKYGFDKQITPMS